MRRKKKDRREREKKREREREREREKEGVMRILFRKEISFKDSFAAAQMGIRRKLF